MVRKLINLWLSHALLSLLTNAFEIPPTPGLEKGAAFVAFANFRYSNGQDCRKEEPDVCPKVPKVLGQSCERDTDCISVAICSDKEKTCQCPKNFVTKSGNCIPAPTLNGACPDGVCAEPFVCNQTVNVCDCPSYMKKTYFGCNLECKKGEISMNDKCLKPVGLEESCSSSIQCITAYSKCSEGKCTCADGTKKEADLCLPEYRCPDGSKPLRKDEAIVSCMTSQCTTGVGSKAGLPADTCPEDHFCVYPSYQNLEGFCCKTQAFCPVGDPLTDKNCDDPMSEHERCPPDTHHCFTGPKGNSCCPLPCPSVHGAPAVTIDGQCYPKRQMNQVCDLDPQCPLNAKCLNGTCQCSKGFTVQFGPNGSRCRKICNGTQILVGMDCLELSVPLGPCKHSVQCTSGTKCRKNKCQCPCGLVFYNGQCIQEPTCPTFANNLGVKEPLKSENDMYVECAVPPQASSGCPKGSYCATSALFSGGVCCPNPDATCDNGAPAKDDGNSTLFCDLTNSTECGENQYCRNYVAVALPGFPTTDGVCCPTLRPQHSLPVAVDLLKRSGDSCPPNHILLRDTKGNVLACSYFAYNGECGLNGACFFTRTGFVGVNSAQGGQAQLVFQNENTGLCCQQWPPGPAIAHSTFSTALFYRRKK